MLTTNKKYALKYDYLSDSFKKAFEFLEQEKLGELEPGKYPIDDEQVVAYIQHYTTVDPVDLRFETHDKYFDIQYIISGRESFGYVKRDGLTVLDSYNEAGDITFYQEPLNSSVIVLEAGDFATVAPEDAHKPRVMAGTACEVKKVVVKIKV
ncbi:MAG: YhcH/YjgK/YiaL family protein [Lachnospiraceae bacterium]